MTRAALGKAQTMEPIDVIVVLSLKIPPNDINQIAAILEHINPPSVPHFAGQTRIAVADDATAVINWLEGRTDTLP